MYKEEKNNELPMEKFSFFRCKKCSDPFCGGLKECREDVSEDSPAKFCLDCFDYTSIKGVTNCTTHGRKYIQYKCKFCCNVASHFCFGTTHFCEECHMLQLKGDYLTNKQKEELPECNETCLLGNSHPPNGEEYGLYCLLCIK